MINANNKLDCKFISLLSNPFSPVGIATELMNSRLSQNSDGNSNHCNDTCINQKRMTFSS